MANKKLNLQYVSDTIGDEYKNWQKGDIVLISAQTGTGKNWFIENRLIPYIENKRLLFISNRTNLKREVKTRLLQKYNMEIPDALDDLDNITTIQNITITSYHALQYSAINEEYEEKQIFNLDVFDYIVADEIHFIFTDSSFNNLNRLTFDKLIDTHYPESIKVFMTATMQEVKQPITRRRDKTLGKKSNIHEYTTGIDYSYIKPMYFRQKNYTETLINLIKNDVTDEKWLIFITDLKAGKKMLEALGEDKCSIIKAGTKSDELTSIINNNCFNKRVLICTKAMDNGINIKDDLVKHIVILAWDKLTFIQMLGRKRVDITNAQEVNLYISTRYKKSFEGLLQKYDLKQKQVDLLTKDTNAFNKKYDNGLSRIYDDIIYKDSVTNQFKRNLIGYARLNKDIVFADRMVEAFKADKDFAFVHEQLSWLELGSTFHEDNLIEEVVLESDIKVLTDYIDSIVGEKLFAEQQQELSNLVIKELTTIGNSVDYRTKTLKPSTLENILRNELGLEYAISKPKKERSTKSGHINQRYIVITKL